MKNKIQLTEKTANRIKPVIMRWMDYPEHKPTLGEEIIICYSSKQTPSIAKRELVEWTFKTMNASANNSELKFKWIRLPSIA